MCLLSTSTFNVTIPRTIAIADIHGCCRTFERLVHAEVKLKKSDRLYLLGDYIDRGPDSKGVIKLILRLLEDGYDIQPVLGNHEQMLLDAVVEKSVSGKQYWNWFDNGGQATLKSYHVSLPWEIEDIPFMKGLPHARSNNTHTFVHSFSGDVQTIVVSGHVAISLDDIRRSIATRHIRLDNGCVYGNAVPGFGNLVALVIESGQLIVQENID